MCLYETKMKNPKYQVNKKNMGNVPKMIDRKLEYIKTGCGWCKECRRKIANDWRIRLLEEIIENKNAKFVTLSLSGESIMNLENDMYKTKYRGISEYNGETDVNLLASFAVRRWTERWRKKMKKAPRHFLITEIGEKNTERIHLHGLVWGDNKIIEKTWQYGNIWVGEWVDERTINYITKYITKLDKKHKGYKQAIFVSKGLGKQYIEKNKNKHRFFGANTNTKYKFKNGWEYELPRYYKEKLWTEEEREQLYINRLEEKTIWVGGEEIDKNLPIEEFNKKLKKVREDNLRAGYGNNETVVKKYIITEAMKVKKRKNYDDLKSVQCINKREITEIRDGKEGVECGKNNMVNQIYYGKYIGTTTKSQRNYNELLEEANRLKISIKTLRLIKNGVIDGRY